jgi:hypothetical protein
MNIDNLDVNRLHNILGDKKKCKCGRVVDQYDIKWNNASTEAGTPCCSIFIICEKCGNEILSYYSWYPEIEHEEELFDILEEAVNDV